MANDRETKSFEVKPHRLIDNSAAIRASDTGDRLTRGEAGGTMGGNKDADVRAHGESGSSGVGLSPAPDNRASIHTREDVGDAHDESGGGSGALGASGGGSTGNTSGSSMDR